MNEDSKISEADFFLGHLERAKDDPNATRYHASALISAARSALLYALREARGKSGGSKWYDSQTALDPVVKFLRDHRDIDIHHRPLPMHTNVTIRLSGVVAYMNSSTNVVLPPPPDPPSTTTYNYIFKGWNGSEDVVTLCRRYIEEIKRIVTDGRSKGFLT